MSETGTRTVPAREEPIEAKVAQILNRRELVINRGESSGVTEGMTFAVLNRKGASIIDPDTGEDLGSVPLAKVLVQVTRVEPRLAVCRTFRETLARNIFDLFGAVPAGTGRRIETLKSEDKPYEEELDERESYVKIGDPAIQVRGHEFITD